MAWVARETVTGFAGLGTVISRLVALAVPTVFFAGLYFGLAAAFGAPEAREIGRRFRRFAPQSSRRNRGATNSVNPFCLRPVGLLAIAQRSPETLAGLDLHARVGDVLRRPSWSERNIGVKLVGRLRLDALVPDLVRIAMCRRRLPLHRRLLGGDFVEPGFLRRNAFDSLVQVDHLDDTVEQALIVGLRDPYWETRTAAARAVTHFADRLSPATRERLRDLLERRARKRNFEVARAATGALAELFDDEEAALTFFEQLHFHRNWKVRDAVVAAYRRLAERGVVTDRERLRQRLDDILVTCESFYPSFKLKESLRTTREFLSTPRDPRRPSPDTPSKGDPS